MHTITNDDHRGNNMKKRSIYCEKKLRGIAQECQEFEHVINAMGYGASLLNVSAEEFFQRCNDCVNWSGGECAIFQREVHR